MKPTILFVPGLRDHVADHWQTLLAAQIPGSRTVPPLSENRLSRDARVEALNAAIEAIDGPIILVAHSAGCLTVAHWAGLHDRPIQGALLATPTDVETPLPAGYPTHAELSAGGWLPLPRQPLPFPSIVAASLNDPLAAPDRIADLAHDWGAAVAMIGSVGHLNPQAGFGPWPYAHELIRSLEPQPVH